mgnify:CR=1 FL=1
MKKYFNYLADGNLLPAFFTSYLLIFIISSIRSLLLFSFGTGDIFFKVFDIIRAGMFEIGLPVDPFISIMGLMGSLYWVIISPLFYLLFIFFYSMLVQFILYVFIKGKPKRFSSTLSILMTTAGFFYILKMVPFVGSFLFFLVFLYVSGSYIAKKNLISKWKGIFFCAMPPLVLLLLLGSFIFSIIGLASYF